MDTGRFGALVHEFLKAVGMTETPPPLDDLEFLSLEHDGRSCRVFPHETDDLLILEVEVLHIPVQNLGQESVNKAALFLHKINNAARFSNQIIAVITDDDALLVSKILPAQLATGESLCAELAMLVDAADQLASAWEGLMSAGQQKEDFGSQAPGSMLDRV
jgi:Tir chaperone protein (CesT) family